MGNNLFDIFFLFVLLEESWNQCFRFYNIDYGDFNCYHINREFCYLKNFWLSMHKDVLWKLELLSYLSKSTEREFGGQGFPRIEFPFYFQNKLSQLLHCKTHKVYKTGTHGIPLIKHLIFCNATEFIQHSFIYSTNTSWVQFWLCPCSVGK